jgi:uncharacterized membrane protein
MTENPSAHETHDSNRVMAIVVYLLYLLSLPLGFPAIIGAIIAYVKRDEARGTVYESHYANAIEVFWVFFGCMLVIVPLCFIVIGFPFMAVLYIWVIFHTVKGLVRALDARPY